MLKYSNNLLFALIICIFHGSSLFYLTFSVGNKVFIVYSADLLKRLCITNIYRNVSFYSLYDLSFFSLTNLAKDFSILLIFWKNQLWLLIFLSIYWFWLLCLLFIYLYSLWVWFSILFIGTWDTCLEDWSSTLKHYIFF